MADEVAARHAQRAHQGQQIIGHMFGAVHSLARAAQTAAAMIMRNHPEMPGQCLHLIGPEHAAPAQPGNQKQIGAAAGDLAVDLDIIDRNAAGFGGDWHGHPVQVAAVRADAARCARVPR